MPEMTYFEYSILQAQNMRIAKIEAALRNAQCVLSSIVEEEGIDALGQIAIGAENTKAMLVLLDNIKKAIAGEE